MFRVKTSEDYVLTLVSSDLVTFPNGVELQPKTINRSGDMQGVFEVMAPITDQQVDALANTIKPVEHKSEDIKQIM